MKKTVFIFLFLFYNILANSQSATLLKDITPGLTNSLSEPHNLTTINGILFFSVRDNDNSLETLWKSDGTVNGTVLIKSFPIGNGTDQFTNVNGVLYFVLNYFDTGQQLWKSNGTTNSTTLVKTFTPQTSAPFNLVNLNGTLIFSNYELATGFELWKTDGTAAGTVILKDVNPSNSLTTYPYYSTNINGTLFFGEDDGTNGLALWKSNGLTSGTVLVKNISPMEFDNQKMFVDLNGIAFFTALDNTNVLGLWKSDGTNAGTILVKDLTVGVQNSNLKNLHSFNNVIYFTLLNATTNNNELWKSDGSVAGTQLVKQIFSSEQEGKIAGFTTVNQTLFFYTENKIMIDAVSYYFDYEIWKSDGTTNGTVSIKNCGTSYDGIGNMKKFNNDLVFSFGELWKSDGTFEGTLPISTISLGITPSVNRITPSNNILFFIADNGINGRELWKYGADCGLSQPAIITGNGSPTAGSSVTYVVEAVAGATSYLWTLPSDSWSGSSTSNSISVVTGTLAGTLAVSAVNNCGISTPRILSMQNTSSNSLQTFAGGLFHSLSICNDGSVMSWGWNVNGELGNGTNNNSNVPSAINSFSDVKAVVGGRYFSLALKNNGTVWSWGDNFAGQLGNGTNSDSNNPVLVNTLTDVVAIKAGEIHSLALKNDGTVWSWGHNNAGQLGNGTNSSSTVPVMVSFISEITAVAGGSYHSLALKNDGTVWAWGGPNFSGILGNGTNNQSNIPVQVNFLSEVIAIEAGGNNSNGFSLALKNDGTVWSWGSNYDGELGIGNNQDSNIPVQINSLSGIIAIEAGVGSGYALALKNDGTVWSWGSNSYGELGNGTTADTNIPIQINSLNGIVAIAAAGQHCLVRKNDGTLWAWGHNSSGQLGVGNTQNSTIPLQVINLCDGILEVIKNSKTHQIIIFPNPSTSILNIETQEKIIDIKIIDITGRTTNISNLSDNKIDISNLSNGMYFIEIKTKNGLFKEKFIKI